MLKVLSYDPALAAGSGDFVVGIPFAPDSETEASALASAAGALDVKT